MSLILSGTDGLSDVDGTAATPAIRGTDANTGIFFGTDIIGFSEGGVEAARINANSQFVAAAGTAALPVITTTGDVNTGIFFPAADMVAASTGGTERMRIDSAGNVGIGTSSAAQKLNLQASGNTYLLIEDTLANGYNAATLYKNTDRQFRVGTLGGVGGFTSGAFIIYDETAAAWRMVIDSSGNLLVNQTSQSSSSKLAVAFNDATNQGIGVKNTGGSGGRFVQFLSSGGSEIGSIQQNGASATSYVTSSDYRLKENIAPMVGALETIAGLKPVTYKWKIDGANGQGFIAHELQAVVPDCVAGEKDAVETYTDEDGNEQTRPKYQGIDTSFLVATLTAAIQEQQALITALTARITALETP